MGFLLILSALLSAATGALSGERAPEAAARHEAVAEAVAVVDAAVAIAAPAEAWAPGQRDLIQQSRIEAAPKAAPAKAAPLETERLIE